MNDKEYRVLMFKIPAAAMGIPTDWKTNNYERTGESLVTLKQYEYRCNSFTGAQGLVKRVLEQTGIAAIPQDIVEQLTVLEFLGLDEKAGIFTTAD